MTILFICKLYSSKGNGVVVAMENEIKYLQNENKVALFNLGVNINNSVINNIFLKNEFKKISMLPIPYNKPDLVIFEEIYKIEYIKLYKECKKCGIPYLIIPHGSLVTLEQKRKFLKKKVANILFFNRFVSSATAIQFLNYKEQKNSKFKYSRSIIIPNGLDMKNIKDKKFNIDCFSFVFIGRYSIYTKGLDLLLQAFLDLKDWCIENNVILNLYGIGTKEELNKLNDFVVNNNIDTIVKVNGPIYNSEKEKVLLNSTVFIQVSRHEGQPMGIIEALSYGLPCIVTDGTSFKDYCNDNYCGIGIDFNLDELIKSIKKIYLNHNELEKMSINALKCSHNDFDLEKITNKTLKIYDELINEK